jgi:PadR family transcriptional regulator AphA
MSERRSNRISPEYVLLGFLAQAPSYGYELHQRMEALFGNIWHASQSQTYNILKRLTSQGYIQSTEVLQEKLPARQQLSITTAGIKRFKAWLARPNRASVHAIRVEFITRLYFTQLYYPERVREMILDQAESVESGLERLQKQLEQVPADQPFCRLALELRKELLRSVALWLEKCMPDTG